MKTFTYIAMIGSLAIGKTASTTTYENSISKQNHISKIKSVAENSFEQKNEAVMLVTIEGEVYIYNFIPGLFILLNVININRRTLIIIRSEKEDHPKIFAAPL